MEVKLNGDLCEGLSVTGKQFCRHHLHQAKLQAGGPIDEGGEENYNASIEEEQDLGTDGCNGGGDEVIEPLSLEAEKHEDARDDDTGNATREDEGGEKGTWNHDDRDTENGEPIEEDVLIVDQNTNRFSHIDEHSAVVAQDSVSSFGQMDEVSAHQKRQRWPSSQNRTTFTIQQKQSTTKPR